MGGLVNERLKKDAFDERASTVYLSRNITALMTLKMAPSTLEYGA